VADRKGNATSCRHEQKPKHTGERRALNRLPKLERIDDLLSPEEQQQLYADLAEMARRRRRAEDAAANIPMP
jgi:hypothetical protein